MYLIAESYFTWGSVSFPKKKHFAPSCIGSLMSLYFWSGLLHPSSSPSIPIKGQKSAFSNHPFHVDSAARVIGGGAACLDASLTRDKVGLGADLFIKAWAKVMMIERCWCRWWWGDGIGQGWRYCYIRIEGVAARLLFLAWLIHYMISSRGFGNRASRILSRT